MQMQIKFNETVSKQLGKNEEHAEFVRDQQAAAMGALERLERQRLTGHGPGRIREVSARQQRRAGAKEDARVQKLQRRARARHQMQAADNDSTALGLARVYLEGRGTPAMRDNVTRHIASLADTLARQQHPEVFADDTLSPDDQFRAEWAAREEARQQIAARLQAVLS